ncbi:MAG: ribonuclease HII [Pigmentiphaga sp.]|nr:ribonuclease HII [Pigmentiphaga sp.]
MDPRHVCGVDEAGRGPLAGPVVAAAVILDPARPIPGLADSKALTAARREALAERIRAEALAWSVAEASVEEIDTLNILHATMLAMQRAIERLSVAPRLAQIDGNRAPRLACAVQTVIKGDARVACIAAASILAKTVRDSQLSTLHASFPQYGFDQHKGYGTAAHLLALREFGACAEHRRSFAPVREALRGRGSVRVPVQGWIPDEAAGLSPPDSAAARGAAGDDTGLPDGTDATPSMPPLFDDDWLPA